MGTRSITVIREDNQPLVTIYRQYDGYVDGHGKDLVEILRDRKMVNGIPGGANSTKLFNGAGCMAAQVIRQLKDDEAGNIYIAPNDSDTDFVDYTYTIDVYRQGTGFNMTYSEPRITVQCWGTEIFAGTATEFIDAVYGNTIEG